MQLEMETETYDYKMELESAINTGYAVADVLRYSKMKGDELPKSEKKRLQLLKELCKEYEMKAESCTESQEYKELLEQFRTKADALNSKYRDKN